LAEHGLVATIAEGIAGCHAGGRANGIASSFEMTVIFLAVLFLATDDRRRDDNSATQ
jgi:hypothetical protein